MVNAVWVWIAAVGWSLFLVQLGWTVRSVRLMKQADRRHRRADEELMRRGIFIVDDPRDDA